MYRIVRVNNENHPTRELALHDLATIIERGFWWRMNSDVDLEYGTLLVGMGCYGGAGHFIVGIVAGEWEAEPDGDAWTRRIPVVWQPVIYSHGSGEVGKRAVKHVDDMLGVHVVRSNMTLSQPMFRKLLDYVLSGVALDPWQYAQDDAA